MPYKDAEKKRLNRNQWAREHPWVAVERAKRWNALHPERIRERAKRWNALHPERIRERASKRTNEKIREIRRRTYFNVKKKNPEMFMLKPIVRKMLKRADIPKETRSYEYIGCSPGFLRNHLESLFKPGMTWANHGEWHVDHIIPISLFPFQDDPSLLFVASHWTNLQPLWGKENLSKGPKYPLDESRSA